MGLSDNNILHTYPSNKPMIHLNPVYLQFFNGNVSEMNIPIVWTFKRTAEALGAASGINPSFIAFTFAGRRLVAEKALID